MKGHNRCELPLQEPRQRYRAIFFRLFQADGRFVDPGNYATRLERSCYNRVIESCTTVVRSWDSEAFVGMYSSRCGTLVCNLDPDSSVCRAHGTHALDQLAAGHWSPDEAGRYTSGQLCPAAASRERDEITLRSQQRIEEKTSQLYQCPHCRARHCTIS